jgi:hypothetical protein
MTRDLQKTISYGASFQGYPLPARVSAARPPLGVRASRAAAHARAEPMRR